MNPDAGTTSLSLLVRVKARDDDAWARLVELYGPLVFHWTQKAGLDEHSGSDVLQEVFSAVAKSIEGYRQRNGSDSFRGWLYTITRNKVRDHYRSHANSETARGGSSANHAMNSIAESEDEYTGTQQLSELFHRALELVKSEFEPRTWSAFWRSAVEGERTRDIAADLGMSANNVRQAKSRVLRRLRSELGDVESCLLGD